MIDIRSHHPQANISIVGFSQLQGHCALDSRGRAILPCFPKFQTSYTSLITAASSHASDDWPTQPPTPHLLNDWSVLKTPIQAPH
jgi:hypothetical protein